MTNEEKALEMFPDMPTLIPLCIGVREKLVEMAEWKDQQFIEKIKETFGSGVEINEVFWNIHELIEQLIR